ncbi:hypothetical protein LTR84_000143 [Exophiala bonariae]|uniref:Transcription factor domain-containing protein n=1 Tax=Exophiala bonariae TaxID=1690606 RepID=A0AAV9NSC7_9EURO|nr:hypothetical protein LTR84_000143 [Exophiala bonariae]
MTSILLTAVFRKFATSSQNLDIMFNHIDRAITVLQAMEECMVARNAICIIKRALARAKGVEQPVLKPESSSTILKSQNIFGASALNSASLSSPINFDTVLPAVGDEADMSEGVEYCFTWLGNNPNPFDDYQQALFWSTWGQEVDLLGK